MLHDDQLLNIIERLRKISHIITIRIHTRMPVWNPYRVTDKLAENLSRFHPLWVVTHINHSRELSDIAKKHIAKFVDNGIMVMNQWVLLKGVNDSVKVQRELIWALIKARIKPYYLHHLDKAEGISHFRTSIRKGIKILKELRGTVPGYAIPHYIVDLPGGYGKVPIQFHYLNEDENNNIIIESPEGKFIPYVDGVEDTPIDIEESSKINPINLFTEDEKEKLHQIIENGNE